MDSLTSLPWESVDLVTKRFSCTKSEPFIASLLLHFLLGDDVEEGWLGIWKMEAVERNTFVCRVMNEFE